MVSVRPFQFTNLPRYTKQQVAFHESLAVYLSYRPLKPEFGVQLQDLVGQVVKVPCQISKPELKPVGRSDLAAQVPALACLMLIGAAPGEHKIIVDFDTSMAAFVIERLLGGGGQQGRVQRAFTDIETGVLSYLVLHVLTQFQHGWESGREIALSLDRFASTLDDLSANIDAETGYQQLGFRISLGQRNGYMRVYLPDALITQRFGTPVAQSGSTPQELDYMRRRLPALGERSTMARLQISHLDLQPKDIANVEAGDIIVLENHQLTKTADGIEGEIFVKLGTGKNGGFVARLLNDESEADQARLEVVKIVTQEQPVEEDMAAEQDGQEDNLQETEGLLRDVEASVVVELGRIRMNTAQVVRLRAGQILRLTRGPNDPVDLVVNGKLFARGELIEVEGELGVRLTQVAG